MLKCIQKKESQSSGYRAISLLHGEILALLFKMYPAGRIYSKKAFAHFVWACDSSVTAHYMPDRLLHVVSIWYRPTSTAESSTRLSYRGTSSLVAWMLYNCDSLGYWYELDNIALSMLLTCTLILHYMSLCTYVW